MGGARVIGKLKKGACTFLIYTCRDDFTDLVIGDGLDDDRGGVSGYELWRLRRPLFYLYEALVRASASGYASPVLPELARRLRFFLVQHYYVMPQFE